MAESAALVHVPGYRSAPPAEPSSRLAARCRCWYVYATVYTWGWWNLAHCFQINPACPHHGANRAG